MEVEDAFEKWLADWFSRNPSGELSPKTVWFVAMRLGYGQNADKIAALEAERDAYKAKANLYKHMVITCGVAATHSDANLTRTGSYAEKWNSQQAEQVRALRAERDALRKSVDGLADTLKSVHEAVCETLGIDGDDSLPELVADWAEGEYAALRQDAERYRWLKEDRNLGSETPWIAVGRIKDGISRFTYEYADLIIDRAIAAKGVQS